jgi:hypothetical protein
MAEEPPDLIRNVPAEWRRRWGEGLRSQFEVKRKPNLGGDSAVSLTSHQKLPKKRLLGGSGWSTAGGIRNWTAFVQVADQVNHVSDIDDSVGVDVA